MGPVNPAAQSHTSTSGWAHPATGHREKFTLDEGPVKAVKTAFVRLYKKGLIYRGERIINWCPRCGTALSDLEVQSKDLTSNMWHMKYPYEDGSGYVTVATTRPETYLGDSAVAVNPEDERYTHLVGKKVDIAFYQPGHTYHCRQCYR